MQGFMRDTCGIHVSAVVSGYIEDTCGIHQGYIMRDMYLKCMQRGIKRYVSEVQDTCEIHAGYMYPQRCIKIHTRYIRDT
jgi:hypothetical protein